MKYREIVESDVEDVLVIRTSTVENDWTMEQLAEVGITPASVTGWMRESWKGWLCEIDGKPVGFTFGDSATGEMQVVALLPGYERRGVGKGLMSLVQEWLFSKGHDQIFLWSNPDPTVRAHGFYRRLGWKATGETKGSDEKLVLDKPGD